MSVLAINGVNFGGYIAGASLSESAREIGGGISRAHDGTARSSRIAIKRDISFSTVPLTLADSAAVEGMVLGLGHHWSFTYATAGYYSSKGLGPETSGLVASIQNVAGISGVNGVLRLTATTGGISYIPSFSGATAWTFLTWRYESSAWHHYVFKSDGHRWRDGVRNDSTDVSWIYVNTSLLQLNNSGSATDYDEMTLLPYVIPDTWPPLIYAANCSPAFGPAPAVNVSGDLVSNPSVRSMRGAVSSKSQKAIVGGSLQVVRVLSIALEET